jgi:hypothetical protein
MDMQNSYGDPKIFFSFLSSAGAAFPGKRQRQPIYTYENLCHFPTSTLAFTGAAIRVCISLPTYNLFPTHL